MLGLYTKLIHNLSFVLFFFVISSLHEMEF